MSQYVELFLDNLPENKKNIGLRMIIAFIGQKENKRDGVLDEQKAYKAGKRFVNARLHKWNSTAIERLVNSKSKRIVCDAENKIIKFIWKIHNRKAKKIFKAINDILTRYDDDEVRALFIKISKTVKVNSGADVAGSPYYQRINDKIYLIANNFNRHEIDSLTKFANEITSFSTFL